MNEGCSMTPPSSPRIANFMHLDDSQFSAFSIPSSPINEFEALESGNNDYFPCFTCLGEINSRNLSNFHFGSYLKERELLRLTVGKSVAYRTFDGSNFELFGFHFTTDSALLDIPEKLFFIIRQHIKILEENAKEVFSYTSKQEISSSADLHQEVVKFLCYLKAFCSRYPELLNSENNYKQRVLNLFRGLLVQMGWLSELPGNLIVNSNQGNKCTSASYHLFHLYLDIRWSIAEVLYLLEVKRNYGAFHFIENNMDLEGVTYNGYSFNHYISSLLLDLIGLAEKRFLEIQSQNYDNISPFSCTCVLELWLLIIHLLDSSKEQHSINEFWTTFNDILIPLIKDQHGTSPESGNTYFADCDTRKLQSRIRNEKLEFFFWLLYHIARLYKIDSTGNKIENTKYLKSNYQLLEFLWQTVLKEKGRELKESQLRFLLSTSSSVCVLWEPSGSFLPILWDFFFRQLNSTFCLPGTLNEYPILSKSGLLWFHQIKHKTNSSNFTPSSFNLFLNLVTLQINRSLLEGNTQDWRQIKGRIFAKFHMKKIQELNETGLHNFFNLFLTFAYIADLNDVISKLCAFVDFVKLQNHENSKLPVIWNGMFAALLICNEKKEVISELIDRLNISFSDVCRELITNSSSDQLKQHNLRRLIKLYAENLQDVIDISHDFRVAESLLLGQGFKILLADGGSEELQFVLDLAHSLMTKIKISSRIADDIVQHNCIDHHSSMKNLCAFILPFIKAKCTDNSVASFPILADIAAAITIAVFDFNIKVTANDMTDKLFHYFGINFDTQAIFKCRYLCHALSQKHLMEFVFSQIVNLETLLIRSWICCGLYLPTNNQHIQELTRLLQKYPQVKFLYSLSMESGGSHDNIMIMFFKELHVTFQSIKSFSDRISFKDSVNEFLGGIPKYLNHLLKICYQQEDLMKIYRILGHLVKYCSPLLYIKSKSDNILQSVIADMVLPRSLYLSDKPLPSALQAVLRETLHLFIDGLLILNQKDPYVNHRLKDITIQYILKFNIKPDQQLVTSVHPLISCLVESFSNTASEMATDFLIFVLEVVRDTFLLKKNQQLNAALPLLEEVINRCSTKSHLRIFRILAGPLLNLLLTIDDYTYRKKTLDVLLRLLEYLKFDEPEKSLRNEWLDVIREVVVQHMQFSGNRVFKLLETIAESNCDLVVNLIPLISESIHKAEEDRGVGEDITLRNGYHKLLKTLGVTPRGPGNEKF